MDDKLSLEKLKIHERLSAMESADTAFRAELRDFMTETAARTKNVELMIHGDPSKVDKYTRDGMNRRIEFLESINHGGEIYKNNLIKIAVASIAIGLGGSIIWVFDVIREAFIKRG